MAFPSATSSAALEAKLAQPKKARVRCGLFFARHNVILPSLATTPRHYASHYAWFAA